MHKVPKVQDIYEKDGVYYQVTEVTTTSMSEGPFISKMVPLSRWILFNYTGTIEQAQVIFEKMIQNYKDMERVPKRTSDQSRNTQFIQGSAGTSVELSKSRRRGFSGI